VLAICGEHEHGESVLRRALELNRYDEGTHGYLGWVLAPSTARANLDEIKAVLDRLLTDTRKHPGRPFWFLHRSVALTCSGDFEGALTAARVAVNFSPSLTLAWLHAVNALGQLGRLAEARALISRCPLDIERPGTSWEKLLRLTSRDAAAAELRTAGLKQTGLLTSAHSRSIDIPPDMSDPMMKDFITLWQRATAHDASQAGHVYRSLADHYAEPERHYHTLGHISHCLAQAALAAALLPNADSIKLAIWFHDVVWNAGARDNEARSAAYFRNIAADAGMPSHLLNDIERLILMTEYGQTPLRPDEVYIVDIDYSSFGLPWELFLADSVAVRAERTGLSDELYASQHSRFLQALLARETLYRSDFFRARYEDTARSNIRRYLRTIGPVGTPAAAG